MNCRFIKLQVVSGVRPAGNLSELSPLRLGDSKRFQSEPPSQICPSLDSTKCCGTPAMTSATRSLSARVWSPAAPALHWPGASPQCPGRRPNRELELQLLNGGFPIPASRRLGKFDGSQGCMHAATAEAGQPPSPNRDSSECGYSCHCVYTRRVGVPPGPCDSAESDPL